MAMVSTEPQQDVFRPLPDFPPSFWGSTFTSLPLQDSEYEAYTKEVEELKEKVKHTLMQSTGDLIVKIELINMLCRLGLSYHFENEIDVQLNQMFNAYQNLHEKNDYDLYTLATLFRVLRQHGYKMSCDVFEKLKNSDGEFSKDIAKDVKGLLSLYEASFLGVHGEDILDEAQDFSKKHLEALIENSNPNLSKHIKKSLYRPFHHGLERIEALHYISFYENEESHDETLLRFAKLDFNRLQLLYRKEIALVSKWMKDLKLAEKFPYSRERIVESYFWILGSRFEPQHSFARMTGAKHGEVITILDDTYDSYGSIDELKLFTAAFQRCTINPTDKLPNYMKELHKTIYDVLSETGNYENEGIRYRTSYTMELYQRIAKGYFVEAQWMYDDKYVPSFVEYIKNGLITAGMDLTASSTMIGIDELEMKDYEWLKSNPKLIQATSFIVRVMNDLDPHEVIEYNGRDCRKGLQSYMNEYGVLKEEAIEGILKMCMNAWKDLNEACMKPNAVSRIIMKIFVNHARVADFLYRSNDFYTYSSGMKDVIESLFIHQLPL